MADILIQHLKQKGEVHSALKMLVNQWGFDEKLIPKALQTIGSLFPHYSRHDESHSKQILVNIERLLGDNIKLLSATDTWLLLEAAYWHDIGMVVPQEDIAAAQNDPDFQEYIDTIINSPHHELNRFAKSFNAQDVSKCFNGADTPMEGVDKLRQLMAEWFRRQHPRRAEKIVQAPWASVGISSPRTELIPARLFKLLGRICQMHGVPFKELLLPGGLPFKEAGLAQEDCHPRFVACLLRMGDLLDLDDNRFCPVMQRIAGENRPHISKAHEDKHAGVRHLRIDRERIEISAECETIDGYLETFKWFDWLKQEMQDQMANWQDIVPNRALGLLPTLGTITVRLSGELQILKEGQRPQFSVDDPKAIDLLQGHNLYSSRFACVRELLQNAIDATLLRLWLTEGKKRKPQDWESPLTEGAQDVLNSASVTVALTEAPCVTLLEGGKSAWTLRITDEGTGISQADLAHMLRIGGSQRNVKRQSKINTMPEWMKPSGAFGIGFQSAFMICDEVTLTTKSIFTNETLQVEMHSPTGSKEGLVLLKLLEHDISRPYGTTVEISLQLDTFAESWSISHGDVTSIASQFINSMDPVLDVAFPFEAAQLADKITAFAVQSPLSINATLTTADGIKRVVSAASSAVAAEVPNKWNFVKANDHALAICYRPTTIHSHPYHFKAFYRGQIFEYKLNHFPCVQIEIDLMSGKAGTWLTTNRDRLVPQAEEDFYNTVLAALEQQVEHDLANASSCELLNVENQPVYSFFLETMALRYGKNWACLAKKIDKNWLKLNSPSCAQTFQDYFKKSSWILSETIFSGESSVEGCDLLVDRNTLRVILNEWLKEIGGTVQILDATEIKGETSISRGDIISPENIMDDPYRDITKYRLFYQMKREPQNAYSSTVLATRLAGLTQEVSSNRRFTLHCDERWSPLFLKNGTNARTSNVFVVSPHNSTPVLLPFLYLGLTNTQETSIQATPIQLESLCKWVQPHLVTPASLIDIRKAYDELIEYIDNTIMKPSPYWALWQKARGVK